MNFKEKIQKIAEKYDMLKASIASSEEATKDALVRPMIRALGYDDSDTREVEPQGVCDPGSQRKVDFLIKRNNAPVMIWECKVQCGKPLTSKHYVQLGRYFPHTNARIGVLTNGVQYRFYTDIAVSNRMDEKPFFEFDITKISDSQCESLERLSNSHFNIELILANATERNNISAIKDLLFDCSQEPPNWLVKEIIREAEIKTSRSMKDRERVSKWVKAAFTSLMQAAVSEKVSAVDNKATVPAVSNGQDNIRDEKFRQWFEGLSSDLKDVFSALEKYTQSLDSGVISQNRMVYRTYSSHECWFMTMGYAKKKILLFLRLDPDNVIMEEGFTREVAEVGHVGMGDIEVSVSSSADLSRVKSLIKDAYESIKTRN